MARRVGAWLLAAAAASPAAAGAAPPAAGHQYEPLANGCADATPISPNLNVSSVAECEALCDGEYYAGQGCDSLDTDGSTCFLKRGCAGPSGSCAAPDWCGYRQVAAPAPPAPPAPPARPPFWPGWPYRCAMDMNNTAVAALVSLTGRVAVVTGANTGIGFETTRALLLANATVVLACKDADGCADAVRRLGADAALGDISGRVDTAPFDLSDFSAVRAGAARILSRHSRLDVLVNNAGCYPCNTLTADGLVGTVQIDHYSHALLASLLLPRLRASGGGRVVNVASANAYGSFRDMDSQLPLEYSSLDDLVAWSKNATRMNQNDFYGFSKFLIAQYTAASAEKEAARPGNRTGFYTVNPGMCRPTLDTPCTVNFPHLHFHPCPQTYRQCSTAVVFAAVMPGIDAAGAAGALIDVDNDIQIKPPYFPSYVQLDSPSCVPRRLPDWITAGGFITWTDADRAAWHDRVQQVIQ